MHKSPLVLGTDATIFKKHEINLFRSLAITGANTGNIIFAEALYNCIQGAVRWGYTFKPQDLEGRDAIVVTAANWINGSSEFTELLTMLEGTDLPVYVIGLGAQSNDKKTMPKMKPNQERLMRFFSDRAQSISVRGVFSAEVLDHYGIKNVDVTGCPSMLLNGEGPNIKNGPHVPEKITLHGTRHHFNKGLPEQDAIYHLAFDRDYDLALQSETAEIYFATQRLDDAEKVAEAERALPKLYPDRPVDEVKDFLKCHGKAFFSLDEWVDYASSRDLFVGTRIHGTIAALLGGTRALLLTHDARTEELAESLHIPHMPLSDFRAGETDMQDLYDRSKPDTLMAKYSGYRGRFGEFLKRNSLALVDTAKAAAAAALVWASDALLLISEFEIIPSALAV